MKIKTHEIQQWEKVFGLLKIVTLFWLCFKKFGCIGGTQAMEIVSLFIIF